jgi:hypothetical protein
MPVEGDHKKRKLSYRDCLLITGLIEFVDHLINSLVVVLFALNAAFHTCIITEISLPVGVRVRNIPI